MKIIINFICVLTFIFQFHITAIYSASKGERTNNSKDILVINPLYDLRVGNFQTVTAGLGFNAVFFDFYIYHTNLPDSGPFEYAAGQYSLYFNPAIANGGTLSYEIVPNSTEFTNPNAAPVTALISGSQLILERNVNLGGNGPIVSSIYPGTRIIKVKLSTTAPEFDYQFLNFYWFDPNGGDSYTQVFAYIESLITPVTNSGTFIIDSTANVLPVELSNFSAITNRNNVRLNWSTSSEINNSGFDIERALTNDQWEKIGFVKGNGTTSIPNQYSFNDNNLNSGNYQYRLKQIDYNGNYQYYDLQTEVKIGMPTNFSLKQNYPNPFNPVTKIDYDIPNDAFVSLKLFDLNGKELKNLISEFKNAGYYSVNLNASALPSGTYFYRLESGNFVSTKKLVVLK